MGSNKNIIILGGGFGGLRTAFDLARAQKTGRLGKEWQIILIDKNSFHSYTPLWYEMATSSFDTLDSLSEKQIRTGACLDFEMLLKNKKIQFVMSNAESIDCQKKTVSLSSGSQLSWEYLVMALGSETEYLNIPGVRENAYGLKSVKEAMTIRRRLHDLVNTLRNKEREKIQIVVGGGGATGVEFAAELAHYFQKLTRRNFLSKQSWSIVLVEASPCLVAAFGSKISQMAHAHLEALGVKIMLDVCVKKVEARQVVLAPRPLRVGEKEEELLCEFAPAKEKIFNIDMLVWTAGIRANNLLSKCGLEVDAKGRLPVDEHLQVKNTKNVFALGDNVLLIDPRRNQPVPALAQAAIYQGKIAAQNIVRKIQNRPLLLYKFYDFPGVVPLGGKRAAAKIGNFVVNGFFGWLIHKAADLRYFLSVLPARQALRLFLSGIIVYSKND